jgi:hypothetical protein
MDSTSAYLREVLTCVADHPINGIKELRPGTSIPHFPKRPLSPFPWTLRKTVNCRTLTLILDARGLIMNHCRRSPTMDEKTTFVPDERLLGTLSRVSMSFIHSRASRSIPNVSSPFHTVMLVCLVVIMSYLAAKVGTTVLIRPQADWPFWPGNVLLVSVLLLVPRRIWPILLASGLVTFAFYNLSLAISIRSIIFFQLSDTAEILTAALGLSYCFGGVPRLDSVKALAKYSLIAVLLAPFAGAFFSPLTTHGAYWRSWQIAFFSQALVRME